MKTIKNLFTVLFVLLISLFLTSTAMSAAPATQPEPKGPKIVRKRPVKVDGEYQSELEFYDENGKVKKKLPIKAEKRVVQEVEERDGVKRNVKSVKKIIKTGYVSKSGKYAGISGAEYHYGYINDAGQEERIDYGYDDAIITTSLQVYNANGDKLWEKTFSKGAIMSGGVTLSDNGEAWALMLNYSDAEETVKKSKITRGEIVEVYDKAGKEILSIPSMEDMQGSAKFNVGSINAISPNGRYLAVNVADGQTISSSRNTRFYNLKTMKHWDSDRYTNSVQISDNGIVDVAGVKAVFDLKEHLGE